MAANQNRNRGKWSLDFTKSGRNAGSSSDLPSPPGFSASIGALHAEAQRQPDHSLKAKRTWDLALGPIKQVSFDEMLKITLKVHRFVVVQMKPFKN